MLFFDLHLNHWLSYCNTHTRTHTEKKCDTFAQGLSWILYVDKKFVISLGATAKHTHLCDDKRKGLSGPLRILPKHHSDKPNFAPGSLLLLENWSNKFARIPTSLNLHQQFLHRGKSLSHEQNKYSIDFSIFLSFALSLFFWLEQLQMSWKTNHKLYQWPCSTF